MADETPEELKALREKLIAGFSVEELATLCQDLGLEYAALPGTSKEGKARELIDYLARRNRIAELERALESREPAEPEARSPLKGLQYFDEADADLFFGRELLTAH